MDGVVLLMGCDKTTPSLLMGAASCDLPTIGISGGPMLSGRFPRQADRLGHRRLADVRGRARRQDVAGRIHRRRILHASLERALHDHGHGVDDGEHGRGARRLTTRQRRDSRRRFAALPAGAAHRPPHRRDGARRPGVVEDPHAPGVRERHQGQRRHRRLDQLRGAPVSHRRAPRRQARARGLGQARLAAALPREPATLRPVPDGRFLLRRRTAGGAARKSKACSTRTR